MHWTDSVDNNNPIIVSKLRDGTRIGVMLRPETAATTGLHIRVNGSRWHAVEFPTDLKTLKTYLRCCDSKEDIENLITSDICDELHNL